MLTTEARKIVRLLGSDVNGDLAVERALRQIKGMGFMFSRNICTVAGIQRTKKIGTLQPDEIKILEETIKNPRLPSWLLNRRKDTETGTDMHVTAVGADLKKIDDINLLKRIKAYRGIRHGAGLPVRGQRSRHHRRKGSRAIGVTKKAPETRKKEG